MKNIFIFILIFTTFLLNAQQPKWTLQQCVDYAHQHNLQLKQNKLNIEQAKINKSTAKMAYLPTLNASTSASWNSGLTQNFTTGVLENQTDFGGNASLSSNINIFNGFRNRQNIKKSQFEIDVAQYNYADFKKNIDMQVALAYMQILLNKESWNTAQKQLENSIKQKEKIEEMIKVGVLPKGDLTDAEAQITNDHLQVIQTENAYQLAKLNLTQLLELTDIDNFKIDSDLSGLQIDESLLSTEASILFSDALKIDDVVKASEVNNEIAITQIKLAKSRLYPSLNGFVNVNTRYSDRQGLAAGGVMTPADPLWTQVKNNRGISYGLSLNIPIFNGLNTRNQIKSANLNAERSEIALENDKKKLRNDVYKMKQDLMSAYQSMKAAEANLKAQRKSYNYATEKFNVGMMNIFDLNTIKTKFSASENQYIRAKYQYFLKSKALELTVR